MLHYKQKIKAMQTPIYLILAPFLFALAALLLPRRMRDIVVIVAVVFLFGATLLNLFAGLNAAFYLPDYMNTLFLFADIALLLYFGYIGYKRRSKPIWLLALLQLLLYILVLTTNSHAKEEEIINDSLSSFMYLIINGVGGVIIIYALKYIESEDASRLKRNGFIALLLGFLGIMNFIVSTNNIETFFLLFELTTLCSFLLIGFRGDDISFANASRALWMNQIGGVAILLALLAAITTYETHYFNVLLEKADALYLLPIVLLVAAAYVKSAVFPMQSWLLGAMVAPTPVSAILHSATMVKIAPFLILKLSVAFTPFLSTTIALFGSFVFMSAAALALDRSFFKEILGLSTISLLALMMALGAMSSHGATTAAMLLILFHAISKALLFLQAGVLEKEWHLKYVEDIFELANKSRGLSFMILLGFASLTLPPFGAFVGKFLAIEAIADQIGENPLYILVLLFVLMGSVFLTLLYFKVATKIATYSEAEQTSHALSAYYTLPSYALIAFLASGIIGMWVLGYLTFLEMLLPAVILFALPILTRYLVMCQSVRVSEYNCGEKDDFRVASYNFHMPKIWTQRVMFISLLFIALTLIGGLI